MSYHNINITPRVTNTQGQVAPPGFHYMPDGTLMSDAEHQRLYAGRTIKSFDLDLSDLSAVGETRNFNIIGDNGAEFTLEIKDNATGYYYNFVTEAFQAAQARLEGSINNSRYSGSIVFPGTVTKDVVNGAVSSGVKVVMDSAVATKMAVGDRVTGNDALNAAVITVAALDPDGDNANEFSLSSAVAIADDEVLSFSGDDQYDIFLYALPGTKHDFYNEVRFGDGTIDKNSSTGSNSLMMQKVVYQYADVLLTMSPFSVGSAITFTAGNDVLNFSRGKNKGKIPFKISATSASGQSFKILKQPSSYDIISYSTVVVGSAPEKLPREDEYPTITETAQVQTGGISSSATIVLRTPVPDITVGDKWTSDGAMPIADQFVQSVTTDGDGNVTQFVTNTAANHSSHANLTFRARKNYQWPLDNVDKIEEGMVVVPSTNVTTGTIVGRYKDTTTLLEGTKDKQKLINYEAPAIDIKAIKPTVVKGLVTTQAGNIVFNKQQILALAGDTLQIGGYGESMILKVHGWDVRFSDLKLTLDPVTTTTTSASSASTSVAITARDGIMNGVSTVGGIGINRTVAKPKVSSGANATGSGTIVLSSAQTLESGITLAFDGAGKKANITGNIEIIKAGVGSPTLRFDINNLLSTS